MNSVIFFVQKVFFCACHYQSLVWALTGPSGSPTESPPGALGWYLCLPLVVASSSLGCAQYLLLVFKSLDLRLIPQLSSKTWLFLLWFSRNSPSSAEWKGKKTYTDLFLSFGADFHLSESVWEIFWVPLNSLRKNRVRKITTQLIVQTSKWAKQFLKILNKGGFGMLSPDLGAGYTGVSSLLKLTNLNMCNFFAYTILQ